MNNTTYGSQPIKNEQSGSKCTMCDKPHFLRDEDAGTTREISRICNSCYESTLTTDEIVMNDIRSDLSRILTAAKVSTVDEVVQMLERHQLSDEDIERAASKYAFENNTHRSNSKAFIAGANFAKQPIANEVDEPIYCNCETPTLGKSITRCGTCDNWFKPLPHTPKK